MKGKSFLNTAITGLMWIMLLGLFHGFAQYIIGIPHQLTRYILAGLSALLIPHLMVFVIHSPIREIDWKIDLFSSVYSLYSIVAAALVGLIILFDAINLTSKFEVFISRILTIEFLISFITAIVDANNLVKKSSDKH